MIFRGTPILSSARIPVIIDIIYRPCPQWSTWTMRSRTRSRLWLGAQFLQNPFLQRGIYLTPLICAGPSYNLLSAILLICNSRRGQHQQLCNFIEKHAHLRILTFRSRWEVVRCRRSTQSPTRMPGVILRIAELHSITSVAARLSRIKAGQTNQTVGIKF